MPVVHVKNKTCVLSPLYEMIFSHLYYMHEARLGHEKCM